MFLRHTDPSLPKTGRCRIVREMFEKAARKLATLDKLSKDRDLDSQVSGKEVKVGTIDCMKNIALCRRFRIQGYPSIAFFDVVDKWPLTSVSCAYYMHIHHMWFRETEARLCVYWRRHSNKGNRESVVALIFLSAVELLMPYAAALSNTLTWMR